MKKFIHIDMDCFYAAVEMRDFPQYRNVPLTMEQFVLNLKMYTAVLIELAA